MADARRGYWSTNAPLIVGNHMLIGVSGDFDNLPGMLTSIDPETGKTQWIFYSTPPPGTPDSISGGATGGQMWITGTYDAELNLVFVGTGNPTPVLNGPARPGDNPWTCSIVALNPERASSRGVFRRHRTTRTTGTPLKSPSSSTVHSTGSRESSCCRRHATATFSSWIAPTAKAC